MQGNFKVRERSESSEHSSSSRVSDQSRFELPMECADSPSCCGDREARALPSAEREDCDFLCVSTCLSSRVWMRVLELAFDEDICEAMSFGALSQAYSRVLHDQDFPRRVDNVVYCND